MEQEHAEAKKQMQVATEQARKAHADELAKVRNSSVNKRELAEYTDLLIEQQDELEKLMREKTRLER